MKQINIKKLILPNIPYAVIAMLGTKVGQGWRLAPGADFSAKALHIMDGFAAAFQSALPSFHPIDLFVGVLIAVVIRLVVYFKGKNWSTRRTSRSSSVLTSLNRLGKPKRSMTGNDPVMLQKRRNGAQPAPKWSCT